MPTPRAENLDHILIALADPTRRAILRRLARGEARITDLAAPFAISFNSVSKHIKLLERADLVARRKAGREYILQFRPRPLNEVQAWIAQQQAFWGASLKAIDDLLREEDRKGGPMTEELATARVSHRFTVSPERVYDAWLDPEKLRAWMSAALQEMGLSGEMKRVEVDARVGGKFFFSDMRDAGEAKHWGTYLALDRPRQIVFTWITDASQEADPSQVTITIEPDGAGCVVTIVHEKIWKSYVEKVEGGWSRMLRAIDRLTSASTV